MTTLLRLLLPAILSIVGGWIGSLFEHACPLGAGTWACVHWVAISAAACAVLGALLGKKLNPWKPGVGTARNALRIVRPPPAPPPPNPRVLSDGGSADDIEIADQGYGADPENPGNVKDEGSGG